MKYIDADKLIAEIERLLKCTEPHRGDAVADGSRQTLYWIKDFITSLQQEQPELPPIGYAETYYQKGLHDGIIKGQTEILKGLEEIEKRKAEPILVIKEQEHPEVDFEKELDQWRHKHFAGKRDEHYSGEYLERSSQLDIARHFYELGRTAK